MRILPITSAALAFTVLICCFYSFTRLNNTQCNHNYVISTEKPDISESDRLLWSSVKKIRWEDFQALPDSSLRIIAALTSSSIVYSYYCNNDALVFTVKAIFRKNESWVRPEAKKDFYLSHEALHFDITELFARKLRQKLQQYRFACNQADDMEMLSNEVLDEWRKTDKKYDVETHFSHDMQMQKDWYVFVHEQLFDYREFALSENQ